MHQFFSTTELTVQAIVKRLTNNDPTLELIRKLPFECESPILKRRTLRNYSINDTRTVTRYCDNKADTKNQWVARKKLQHGANKAAVALANKNARIIWAIMATGACYQPELACA